MPDSSYKKGKEAEEYVASFLQEKGWTIIARNFRAPGGEIDLIALDGKEVVVVEIKSGSSEPFSLAESVTLSKRKRIAKALKYFFYHYRMNSRPIRFDVIAVNMQTKKIQHFREEFFDW